MNSIFENRVEHSQTIENGVTTNDYSFYPYEESPPPRSSAIPLPKSHIHRTESEANLTENLKLAEFRDQCMFNRLVNGIQRQQQQLLYNAEIHDTHRRPDSSSRYRLSSRRSSRTQEDAADRLNDYYPHSLPCSRRSSDARERPIGMTFKALPRSHGRSSRAGPFSAEMSPNTLMQENNESIERIMCTRQQSTSLLRDESTSMSVSPLSSHGSHVVTDDEQSDYGMFDMEM